MSILSNTKAMPFPQCAVTGHVSLVDGQFCLLTPGPRPAFHAPIYASRPHRDASSIIPDGECIDGDAWQAQADSPLFKLPFEIMIMIIELLPLGTLGSLALTCRACEQFAKWQQFGTAVVSNIIRPVFHDNILLSKLIGELSTASNDGRFFTNQRVARLGPSIRRLVLRTNASSFTLNSPFDRNQEATNLYSMHLQHIAFLIKYGLPNLKAIRLEDQVPVPRAMWRTLMHSPVRDLEMFNFLVGDPMEPPIPPDILAWPLTSLTIGDIGLQGRGVLPPGSFDLRDPRVEDEVICRLIRLTAPTLKVLRLLCCCDLSLHPHKPFRLLDTSYGKPGTTRRESPLLCELQLDTVCENMGFYRDLLDPATSQRLQALSLSVNCHMPTIAAIVAPAVPHYPSLQHFGAYLSSYVTSSRAYQTHSSLAVVNPLLKANPQLETVELHMDQWGEQLLRTQVLPMLNVHYKNLTSLSIRVDQGRMDNDLLYALGNLVTLQQLRVSIPFWYLTFADGELNSDHKAVRQILAGLKGLRCLVIEGLRNAPAVRVAGQYHSDWDRSLQAHGAPAYNDEEDDTPPPYGYHDDRGPPNGETPRTAKKSNGRAIAVARSSKPLRPTRRARRRSSKQKEQDDAQWQREHTVRMLRHARNYFVRFPHLQWVYFGSRLMGVPLGQGRGMQPRVLGPFETEVRGVTREVVKGFMDSVFGWKGFSVRKLEEWGGVGIDLEAAVLGQL